MKSVVVGAGQTVYGAPETIDSLSSATGLGSLLQEPTKLVVTQSPGNALLNTTLSPVVVDLKDANGNVVTTANSSVTLTLAGAIARWTER